MPSLSRSLEAQMPIEGLDCGERGYALLHIVLTYPQPSSLKPT